jgi:thiamine-phosphate pyrophosphorylase
MTMDAILDEAVGALRRAYRERDFALVEPYLSDDVVLDWTRSISPMRGHYRGIDEARAVFDRWAEAFTEMEWDGRPIFRIGRHAAVAGTFRGRGATSGVAAPAIGGGQAWTLDGDRVAAVILLQTEAESVRWARAERLREARLYFVCEGRPRRQDPGPLLEAALRGGADAVQLRDKALDEESIVAAAKPFREAARAHGALFFVNDRADLVASCGADGVHVGQDDLSVAEARGLAGPAALVGLSTHSAAQVDAAIGATGEARPDQISVGPVWETPTKAGRPATGLELIARAADRAAGIAWFAIGGIDPDNVDEVAAAGAERIVVVRAIRDADDPESTARALRRAVEREPVRADA